MVTREVTVAEQSTALAIESGNPRLVVQRAREIAVVLKELVSLKPNPVLINGEQYLEFEDWQTLGQFTAYAVRTLDAVAVEINGVQGAKARAELLDTRTGLVVGGAEAYCMRDEERWSSRPEYEWGPNGERRQVGETSVPWFQLASMAQTRAGSKAYRNRLAWIAVLAGYKPTPAEEMTGKGAPQAEDDPKYFCKEHKTNWFKRGKMTSYAHPIEGSKDWCRMPSEKPAAQVVDAQPAPAVAQNNPIDGSAPATAEQWAEIARIGKPHGWTTANACEYVGVDTRQWKTVTQAQAVDILAKHAEGAKKQAKHDADTLYGTGVHGTNAGEKQSVAATSKPATVQEAGRTAQPIDGSAPATEAQWNEIKAINERMSWTVKEVCDFVGATKASQVTQAQAIDILTAWREAAAQAGAATGPGDPNYIPELDGGAE